MSVVVTTLLAMIAQTAASASAETSPPASVHGQTRTTAMIGERPYIAAGSGGASPGIGTDSSGALSLSDRRFIPVVQDIFLDARPGVEGVTIALDAWGALDAGDRVYRSRALAEGTEGWVRWDRRDLSLRAGRLFLFNEVGRGDRVDGAEITLHPMTEVLGALMSAKAWAGIPVIPLYGEDPLLHDRPEAFRDPLVVAPGGSDWK